MPVVIPYIAIALSVASAIYAASLDLSPTADPTDTGALINKSGTRATRDVVYGRCLTGATPLWSNVNNSSTNELMQVFSTGIAVTAIHQLYIDNVKVLSEETYRETTNTSSLILSGSSQLVNGFEKQCTIQLRTGFPIGAPMNGDLPIGTPMQLAIDNSDGEWTDKMRGDYTSMVAIKSKRIIDDEAIRIMSESYAVNLEVSGVPVFDPRVSSDPATKSYSRNPALCALDYITNIYYGMGIGFDKVDTNSFATAANHCDANKFYIDGQLNQGESFASNLENICSAAQLHLFIENGKLVCRVETVAMSSWSFNENNILKGTLRVTEQTSASYANVISVNYKNSELDDKEDVFTVPANIYPTQSDPSYPTKPQVDGYIATTELNMPMTRYVGANSNDIYSPMKKFANIELRKQDFQKEIEFDIDREEYNISVFDVIEVSDDAIGWDKKQFRITGFATRISETDMNIVTLKCKEYSSTVYDGSMDGTPPSTKPLPPVEVSQPTNLTFTLQDLIISGSATLSWSRTWFESNVQYDVEYKRSSSSTWTRVGRTSTNEWKFPNLYPDTYDFRVATWSNLYGSSNYTQLTGVVISQLGTFPSVTGLKCDTTTQDFKWTWDDMLDSSVILPPDPRPDAPTNPVVRDYFSHYQVDILDGTTLIDSYQATTNLYDYTYATNRANGILRTIRANVYIVAKDGTRSQLGSADLTASNPQQSAPTGIVDSTELSNTIITWDQPSDFSDYRATRFYQSKTKGFVPSQSNFLKEQVGTLFSHIWSDTDDHYIRFAHVDVFGNDSESFSHEILVTPSTIDGLFPIDPDFAEIRDPQGAAGKEQVFKAADGEYVSGIGIYADEPTKSTKILMAAEQVLMGVGGRPFYKPTTSYVVGDKVLYKRTPEITALYECKTATTGNLPTNTTYWKVLQSNADQAVFAVNESGKVLIRNAVIEDLTSDNIKARSIVADDIAANTITANEIYANTITGGEINSETTIIAGIGATSAGMNGDDSVGSSYKNYRFWSGADLPASAPYRVDRNGKLTATGADINGKLTATSGTMDNVTINQNCTVLGTISATQIVGDIVSGITKTNTTQSVNVTSYENETWNRTPSFGSVTIKNSRAWARTLVITLHIEINENSGAAYGAGRMRLFVAGTSGGSNYYSRQYNGDEKEDTRSRVYKLGADVTMVIPIPANTKPTFTFYAEGARKQGRSYNFDVSVSAPQTNNVWCAYLLSNGGDLS
ncbi:fibronectin type III [Vibrio phage 3.058.O._10N.286.46.B8]|nr:fibronectin type III [Vibrio phage 3.058.O._10N.286.46.B8]